MQIEVVSTILDYANKAGVLLPILACIVIVVFSPQVIKLIDSWKMRKINYLSTLHSNEFLTEDIRKMLKDEINNAAFASIHGMRVGTLLREQLTKLHNQDRDRFTWRRIRMANPYIDVGESEIIVKIGWGDKFNALLSFSGVLLALIAYILSWVLLVFKQDLNTLIATLVVTIIAGGLFFMFMYQLARAYHATLLKRDMEKSKKVRDDRL